MYKNIKVEKCPFCGCAVEAVNGLDYKPNCYGIRPNNLVRCHHCGYTSPSAKDVETAIKKHNRICRAAKLGKMCLKEIRDA